MRFQAMTFNLRYDTPGDGADQWSYRIDAVAAMILEHDPLVVGTQAPELHISEVRIDRSRIQGRYPSDHYPVIAGLELKGGGASV